MLLVGSALFPWRPVDLLCVTTPEGRLTFGSSLAVVVVLSVARYGVESEISVTTLKAAEALAVAPAK